MATISRTGIAGGSTISPTHITNIIDALDGTSATTTVIASGSFSGSLTGHATSATTATTAQTVNTTTSALNYEFFPIFVDADNGSASPEAVYTDAGIKYNPSTNILTTTASFATSASYALSASYAANVPSTSSYALTALSASYAVTASYALNAGGGGSSFPYTGSAVISGSLLVTGSLNVSGSARVFGTTTIVGTTTVTGSVNIDQTDGKTNTLNGTINGNANLVLDLTDLAKTGGTGKFSVPNFQPGGSNPAGTMYWNDAAATLYIYKVSDPAGWRSITLS